MRSAPSLCGRWIGVRLSLSHFSGWRGFPSVSSASSSFSSDSAPDAEGGLRVGQVFEKEVTFTQEQVKAFAEITGDENPIHRQSQGRVGKQIIVPGLLCSSLFPAIIGTQFPGSLYLEQSLHFKKKVYAGETVKARLIVQHLESRRKVTFATECISMKKKTAEAAETEKEVDDHTLVVVGKAKALIR